MRQDRVPRSAENPGFLAAGRPSSYAATQDLVVPKSALYEKILSEVPWKTRKRLSLVEFGFGTGEFLKRLLRALIEHRQPADIVAFDLSPAMGEFAKTELQNELTGPNQTNQQNDISIRLVTGVNCLDPNFTSPCLAKTNIDAIFQLQFAHYAPNSSASPLAKKIQKDGVAKLTKPEWLARIHDWLRPGGRLLDFDDFDATCPLLNDISLKAWDLWVLRSLTNPEVQQQIAKIHPNLARSILRSYPTASSPAALLQGAEHRRQLRRSFCREETATLRAYLDWLESIFGPGRTKVLENPIGFSHHRFHLLLAQKAPP